MFINMYKVLSGCKSLRMIYKFLLVLCSRIVQIERKKLLKRYHFRYLGSFAHREGKIEDVANRVVARWLNWRSAFGIVGYLLY